MTALLNFNTGIRHQSVTSYETVEEAVTVRMTTVHNATQSDSIETTSQYCNFFSINHQSIYCAATAVAVVVSS